MVFALACGGVILLVVQLVDGGRETVVLFGIALVFLCNALTAALHYVADAEAIQQIVFWTIDNLTRAGWTEVAVVFACVALLLPFSLRHVWLMTLLRGGEAQALSMGIDVARLRTQVILRASVLAAFAVCFVGTIGFIGLVGPHIARCRCCARSGAQRRPADAIHVAAVPGRRLHGARPDPLSTVREIGHPDAS